jgi:transcriptional regulator of acetoin/glycerol metabolism
MDIKEERKRLAALVRRHRGNISAIGRELGFTRQGITRHLERHDLLAAAEQRRVRAGISGPRHLPPGDGELKRERDQLVSALRTAGSTRAAARKLGIGESTVARRMRKHRITVDEYRAPF